jgi:hypothetical protein
VTTCGTTGVSNGSGACQLYPSGTVCGAAFCAGGVMNLADTCNGTGQCTNGATFSCSPYTCNAGGTACMTFCTQGMHCQSGFCVDGFCCNTSCAGACRACSFAKNGQLPDGVCGNIASGLDPDNECAASAQSTCGTDGACNGAGACRLWASGTACAPQTCSGTTQTNAGTCNGTGTCQSGGAVDCSPYACDAAGTACLTSCSTGADCAPGKSCVGGQCQ